MVQELAHKRFLEAKRMRHLVFSSRFERVYARLSDQEKDQVRLYIERGDLENLKKYIDKFDGGPLMRLRFIAQQYHIKNYANLTKDQLIEEITHVKKRYPKDPK